MEKIIENAIEKARRGESKLTPEILGVIGFSADKIKHLLNNLISDQTNYLEIGVLYGSTFISALYGNKPKNAFAVDNWSEFGGTAHIIGEHCKLYIPDNNYKLVEKDSFALTKEDIPVPINIYFYDGHHSEESQCKALTYMDQFLADEFILLVDDYDNEAIQRGTQKGIKDMGYEVKKEWHLNKDLDTLGWWWGIYVAVICKKK